MSQMLPSSQSCCRPCDETTTTNIPGAQGPAGADGTNGVDGENAYTLLAIPFIMPAVGTDVTVTVEATGWAVVGQMVVVGNEGSAVFGTFRVASVVSVTQLLLTNVSTGAAASDAYADNSAPGTAFPAPSRVSPAGLQGVQGVAGAAGSPDDATYILQTANAGLVNAQNLDVLTTGLLRSTGGTGVVDTVLLGTAFDHIPQVEPVAGLGAGEVVFATAAGIESKTAADTRTALGLVVGTADTNIPPVDDAAGLTNGEFVRATANGLESITDATARAQLGISGGVGAWLVFREEHATGVASDAFTQGGWFQVVLNTEVVDTGGNGSIAAGIITLAAGTYRARWRVTGVQVENFTSRLYGVTAVAPLGYGSNAQSKSADVVSISAGECRFTVGAGGQVQLEAQCQLTGKYGVANNFGAAEVYSCLELEKET